MPDLNFELLGIEAAEHAATPTLNFKLAINQYAVDQPPAPIQNIALQCQLRIDSARRLYSPQEQAQLTDLFGDVSRWSQTLRNMVWTLASVTVPAFDRDCVIDMPVPCSFDFNLAATKYFHGLEGGEVPLILLFSGTVFYRDADGALAMDLISWTKELKYRMPVAVWQRMMDIYYPNQTFLCVNRDVFTALYEYKRRHGYTGFDEVLTSLLPGASKAAS